MGSQGRKPSFDVRDSTPTLKNKSKWRFLRCNALWSRLLPSSDLSAHVVDPPTSKYRLPPPPTPFHPLAIKMSAIHPTYLSVWQCQAHLNEKDYENIFIKLKISFSGWDGVCGGKYNHLRDAIWEKNGIMWEKFPSGGPPPQFGNFHIFLPCL